MSDRETEVLALFIKCCTLILLVLIVAVFLNSSKAFGRPYFRESDGGMTEYDGGFRMQNGMSMDFEDATE